MIERAPSATALGGVLRTLQEPSTSGRGHFRKDRPSGRPDARAIRAAEDAFVRAAQFGIGYYTWEAYTLQNYTDIVVGMIIIGVLGMTSSFAVSKLGVLIAPWRQPNPSN